MVDAAVWGAAWVAMAGRARGPEPERGGRGVGGEGEEGGRVGGDGGLPADGDGAEVKRPNPADVLARLGLMTAEAEARLRGRGSGSTAGASGAPPGPLTSAWDGWDRNPKGRSGRAGGGTQVETEWAKAGDARASNWRGFHKEWQEHKDLQREKRRKRKRGVPQAGEDGASGGGARRRDGAL